MMVLSSFAPDLFAGLTRSQLASNSRAAKGASREKRLPRRLHTGRKRRAIAQVPKPDLLEPMSARVLITPRLFSRLNSSASAGLVSASSILTHLFLSHKPFGSHER